MYNKKADFRKKVEKESPKSPIVKDCIFAFVVGGIICCIGQLVMNLLAIYGTSNDDTGIYTSSVMIIIAAVLTGLGLYGKLGKYAGAGSAIPITGFSNSISSAAIEFKKEGWILGVGAKIFIIAGPVILYGLAASVVVGIVYYIFS
jgi:stage V sporulation protein AC